MLEIFKKIIVLNLLTNVYGLYYYFFFFFFLTKTCIFEYNNKDEDNSPKTLNDKNTCIFYYWINISVFDFCIFTYK